MPAPAVADRPTPPAAGVPGPDELSGAAATTGWADGTDARGTPHAHLLPDAADWFRRVAASPDADEPAFRGTIRRLAALCDRRGLPAFAPDRRAHRLAGDLAAAARAAGMKKDRPARRFLRSVARRLTPTPPDYDEATAPGFQSDAAAVGLLRADWGRASDALALAWPPEAGDADPDRPAPVGLELRAQGRRLLCGAWGIGLTVDGEPVPAGAEGWECVCHHSDFDGEYLELQWSGESPAGPVRIERQAFLSRRGNFAVLADAVSFPRPAGAACEATVEHAAALPLAGTGPKRATAGRDPATREVRLFGGRPDRPRQRARVFPLNLPQEAGEPTDGGVELPADDPPRPGALSAGWLTVRSTGRGGLYAPVVLDWRPAREDRRADWRALTVTEDRRRLTESEAAAHRLRIGRKHQLLLYRRTDGTAEVGEARAVLGHHHDHETLIAGFGTDGEVTPLLTV